MGRLNLQKLFGPLALLFLVLGLSILTVQAQGQERKQMKSVPNGYELTMLVNSTLAALNHANRTGNYSVLRALGAPSFRQVNSSARLADIFARQRQQELDISATLLYSPVYSKVPRLDAKGMLHLNGYMPTEPFHIRFALVFEKSAGHWRIMAISIAPAVPSS